jgi:sugar-specific transcriptional regulator TrmB
MFRGALSLSLERVLKTLEGLGLSRVDAKMYVYLAKMGPQNASELAEALKITKQQLHPSIKNLRYKGIVAASSGQPPLFCAVAFEKALEILIKAKVEQAKAIKETKKELLSSWRSLNWKDNT